MKDDTNIFFTLKTSLAKKETKQGVMVTMVNCIGKNKKQRFFFSKLGLRNLKVVHAVTMANKLENTEVIEIKVCSRSSEALWKLWGDFLALKGPTH